MSGFHKFFRDSKIGLPAYVAAINMRTGIAVITPIITVIGIELGLSTIELAWLAAIPVLCFAFISPVAGWFNQIGSIDRIISIAMWVLAAALLFRATGSVFALFFFTLLLGIATAVLNVTLPAWVKLHGGEHAGVITGTYVTLMGITSAVALAISAPLTAASSLSWQLAMLPWGVLALLGAIWWQLRIRENGLREIDQSSKISWRTLLRNRRAWQVTAFFGLQSMNAYAGGTWIPTILFDRGYALAAAGLTVAIISLLGSIAAAYVPQLATTRTEQRSILWLFTAITAVGYLGLLLDSGWRLTLWVLFALFGQSATFPLSLILVVLRSETAATAAALSTMMQSIGYLIAATGPLLVGAIFQWSGSWNAGLAFMLVIVALQGIAAAGAGRRGTL
ncbi:MAG: MFS transporter [Actinobacteria bacterium]|uniref:Unannotated protein n=1 Tax=freshwater metagenome TaxID=449393 RepID=A0A6J6E8T2_9ZZZZ|nr:MFS transporter [Actinomycetota bacterium]